MDTKNVLFVGVGGQGTILASRILTMGLVEHGYDVKMSEIHGMSQRGGNVSTQVRFGDKVYSPIIGEGGADVLVSFETMEAARNLNYLKKGGTLVVNTLEIPSMPILSGQVAYPQGIIPLLEAKMHTIAIDATKTAEALGNGKSANVVLLGALVRSLQLENIDWKSIIAKLVKPQFLDVNIKAFEAGWNMA